MENNELITALIDRIIAEKDKEIDSLKKRISELERKLDEKTVRPSKDGWWEQDTNDAYRYNPNDPTRPHIWNYPNTGTWIPPNSYSTSVNESLGTRLEKSLGITTTDGKKYGNVWVNKPDDN